MRAFDPIPRTASFEQITSAKVGCGNLVSEGSDSLESYSGSSGLQHIGDGYWQVNWITSKSWRRRPQGPWRSPRRSSCLDAPSRPKCPTFSGSSA